jgi:hypothetical protein
VSVGSGVLSEGRLLGEAEQLIEGFCHEPVEVAA